MRYRTLGVTFLVFLLHLLYSTEHVRAQFLGEEYNIAQFCDHTSDRRTIVYVDRSAILEGEVNWAERLRQKLKASLMPSEPVVVVALDTVAGRAEEMWTGCFPDYTAAQVAEFREVPPGVWNTVLHFLKRLVSEDPLELVEDQQTVFFGELIKSLADVYETSDRQEGVTDAPLADPPDRNIVLALTADEARFSARGRTTRVVLFTDALEHSKFGSVFVGDVQPESITSAVSNLGLNLGQAIFYLYGAGSTLSNPGEFITSARDFWQLFFEEANAHLAGFGADLTISTSKPIARIECEVSFLTDDRHRIARIQLMPDADGELQDSYIVLPRLASSLIDGSYVCTGTESCLLKANVLRPFLSYSDEEEIYLEGNGTNLVGELFIPNTVPEQDTSVNMAVAMSANCVQ